MTMLSILRAIAAGDTDQVLGPTRLAVGGHELFGIEAVADAFRRDPLELGDDDTPPLFAESARQAAVLHGGQAMFADLYDGRIGRLWRVGAAPSSPPEPRVAVAFDPDLRQARGDLLFDPADHPGLDADAHGIVRAAALALLTAPAWRARAFAIRAFGDAEAGAVLFAVHRLSADPMRVGGFVHAAAVWSEGERRVVADDPALAPPALVRIAA
jgi:hypothetical protein